MERKILIANTRTQRRYTLDNVDVTTLGELKAVLDDKAIDYSGLSFTEGISNTQLLDDSSQLPHDVNYKGTITNDLIIILTNTTKNIPLGNINKERADVFSLIKRHNLQDRIVQEFGRNMTQVSTQELQAFLQKHLAVTGTTTEKSSSEFDVMAKDILASHGFYAGEENAEDNQSEPTLHDVSIPELLLELIDRMYQQDVLTADDIIDLSRNLPGLTY